MSRYNDWSDQMQQRVIGRIFDRFALAWPGAWKSIITDQAAKDRQGGYWHQKMREANMTMDEIGAALTGVEAEKEFPPSFAEFLKAARPPVSKADRESAAFYQRIDESTEQHKRLPGPAKDKELGREAMGLIKDMLKPDTSGKKHRRSIVSNAAGAAGFDYDFEINRAIQAGESLYRVDMRACLFNGWTERDEHSTRARASVIGMGNLYKTGHEPPSWVESASHAGNFEEVDEWIESYEFEIRRAA